MRDRPALRPRGRPRKPLPGPDPGLDHGHNPGTAAANARAQRSDNNGAVAIRTTALPPRLLDLEGAAHYLSVSSWTIRDMEAAGQLRRVRLSMTGSKDLRKLLFDRQDLDAAIENSKDAR